MKSKEILHQVIEYLDAFEEENHHLEEYTMEDFIRYLEIHRFKEKQYPKKEEQKKEKEKNANLLSRQISLMYRYAREYTKMGLSGSVLQTVEEFSFLVILLYEKDLTKTELIQRNAMVKTSGTEVIKRLLKKELVKQYSDKKDRRSQRVAVTEKGKKEMRRIFPKMQLASDVIIGNLSEKEQENLTFLLQKLEAYHRTIFLADEGKSLEELAG